MNDPMRILKADHREAEQLLNKLAESDEGTERQQMVDELTTKLTAHMELEETIIYPSVREAVGQEDEEEAEVEHRLAREGLDKLHSLVDVPGFGAAVEMLKGGILHHVKEEENELLPELKDAIGREQWAAMGDALAAAKQQRGMPVPQPPKRRSSKRRTKAKSR
jgi:hemerythrin superfamily protein